MSIGHGGGPNEHREIFCFVIVKSFYVHWSWEGPGEHHEIFSFVIACLELCMCKFR